MTKNVTISLPNEFIKEVKKFCKNNEYTFSGLVRVSLEEKIKKILEEKKNDN